MLHLPSLRATSLALAVAALATITVCIPTPVLAAEPAAAPTAVLPAPAPGYFHMQLGPMALTSIFDGAIPMEASVFKGLTQAELRQRLQRNLQGEVLQTAVNAFLVESGPHKILIDVGAAQTIGPGLGQITANLQAAGVAPDAITAVFLTHLHLDHVAGLLAADGRAAFPNATVYAHAHDAQHWLSKDQQAKADAHAKGLFDIAQRSLAPYIAAGRFHPFTNEPLALPGLTAYPLFGHSPGHTGYRLEAGGESVVFLGDAVHNHLLQLPDPSITMAFDWNPKQAQAARKKVLGHAADTQAWVAGAHMPFPGIGRVVRDGAQRYHWLPLDYPQAQLPAAQRRALR